MFRICKECKNFKQKLQCFYYVRVIFFVVCLHTSLVSLTRREGVRVGGPRWSQPSSHTQEGPERGVCMFTPVFQNPR